MRLATCFTILATTLALSSEAVATQSRQGIKWLTPGPMWLLRQESVQKELKISDGQIKQIGEVDKNVRDDLRKAFPTPEARRERQQEFQEKIRELMEERDKAAEGLLLSEQVKRLIQINYQIRGNAALLDPSVI